MVSRAVGFSVFCFTGAAVTGKVLHTYGKFWASFERDRRQCI